MSILRRFCGRKTQFFRKIWVGFLSVGKIFSHDKQFRRREIFPHLHVAVHAAGHRKSVVRISTLQILF